MIELTIPATLRPEVLTKTLGSFRHLVRYSREIVPIINVDPVPNGPDIYYQTGKVLGVVRQFFDHQIVYTPPRAGFSAAVKRLWAATRAKYVLHLEDDWEFVRHIELDKCIDMMANQDDPCDYIRFPKRARPIPEETTKIGLSPALWTGIQLRSLAAQMDITKDPEKQLRRGLGNEKIDKWLPSQIKEYGEGIHVQDIGREWMVHYRDYNNNQLRKWDRKSGEEIKWHLKGK